MPAARPLPHPAPVLPGLYSGLVHDRDDPEHAARIQVVVPAVFDGDGAEAAVWARPCLPYGHVFVPELGDRVWVAFEGGDPTAPVWLGTWYPADSLPESARVTPPVRRVVRTSSGHEVLIDDAAGGERILVTDAGGSTIELSSAGVTVTASADLVLKGAGTVTVEGAAIVLKAPSVDVRS
jgi:uncharacterized protein involved in type VI secretion and phage assembly